MLKATFTSLAVFLYFGLAGQSRAFFLNENGLLLQDTAVACLCSTVDSLNQAFETSDPEPNLQSAPQARGHYIEFRTTPPNALADMKAGVDFEQFIKRHSPQKVDRDVIIQKSYAWLNNTAVTQFTYLPYNQNFGNRLTSVESPYDGTGIPDLLRKSS
ncbi:MAG: hypothetical protein KDD12_24920 [Lewinella sp.]|nr:hypothetical protein [Lewinella sp.]